MVKLKKSDILQNKKNVFSIELIIYFVVFFSGFFVTLIYFLMSRFEKTITVSTKFNFGMRKSNQNFISDTNETIYRVSDSLFGWYFKSVEDYSRIKEGVKYKITGYGYRVGFLNMYPRITSVKNI